MIAMHYSQAWVSDAGVIQMEVEVCNRDRGEDCYHFEMLLFRPACQYFPLEWR